MSSWQRAWPKDKWSSWPTQPPYGHKWNDKSKQRKDQPKGKNKDKLLAYDGSELSLPSSSSAHAPVLPNAAQEEDPLISALMAHYQRDPQGMPEDIASCLRDRQQGNPRQMLQKQLNTLRKLETKIKRKEESLDLKKTNWGTWKQNMKALFLQEQERFEKDTKTIQEELVALRIEWEQEQARLRDQSFRAPTPINVEETEEEMDLADLLEKTDAPNVEQPGSTTASPGHIMAPGLSLALQKPPDAIVNFHANATAFALSQIPEDFQAQIQKRFAVDKAWVDQNPEAFFQLIASTQHQSQYGKMKKDSPGSTPKRGPMTAFGAPLNRSSPYGPTEPPDGPTDLVEREKAEEKEDNLSGLS